MTQKLCVSLNLKVSDGIWFIDHFYYINNIPAAADIQAYNTIIPMKSKNIYIEVCIWYVYYLYEHC